MKINPLITLTPILIALTANADPCSMLQKVNSYRAAFGLNPLTLDTRLINSANFHNQEMASGCGLMHDSCNPPMYWADRVANFYPNWMFMTENVASNCWSEEQVLAVFKRSPEHNANLLNDQISAYGSGVLNGYWTQDFGSEDPVASNNFVSCNFGSQGRETWNGRIRSSEGLCLDSGSGYGYGLYLNYCDNNNMNQLFTLIPHSDGDGKFQLYSTFQDGCADVFGWGTGDGSSIGLWLCTGGLNQYFYVNGDGTLRPAHTSNKCVEVPGAGIYHGAGSTVDMWDCNSGSNQQWQFVLMV